MPAFSPSHSLIWSISGVGNQCQHGKTPNPFKPCFLRRLPLGLALVQARAQGFASNRAQVEKNRVALQAYVPSADVLVIVKLPSTARLIQATRDARIGAAMCVGPLHVMPGVSNGHIAAIT